jgi:hypothetical protein
VRRALPHHNFRDHSRLGRPALASFPLPPSKQTNPSRPITTTRRTDSSSSKRLPQPSKPTSNLRPENPWSLSMTSLTRKTRSTRDNNKLDADVATCNSRIEL